jgi:hypothetical protein
MLTYVDDPVAKLIPYRSANTKVHCPRIFSQVRHWLEQCHSTHHNCNESQLGPAKSKIVPTYLLNLSMNNGQVLLERSALSNRVVSYAALSYCWGTTQRHATTRANLDSYMKWIQVRSLPRTIQDAITVTKALGLSYLWVDSLCIIQDSPAEIQHELGLMGAIYHNAYVVITAASARTCEDGFLEDRPQPAKYIKVPFGDDGSVNLIPKLRKGKLSNELGRDPLDDRAWAYQESFMARRLLVFSAHEVVWSCVRTGGDGGGRLSGYEAVIFFNDSCRTVKAPELRHWCFIVETFSRRKLSYETDKLPALSSVAELFGRAHISDYLAGVWAGAAAQLLTWGTRPSCDEMKRPAKWRAPSWSYMSVDGPVGFNDLNGGPPYEAQNYTTEYQSFGWEGLNYDIKVLSTDVPFGEVVDAKLLVRGHLMGVSVGKGMENTRRVFKVEPWAQPGDFEWSPRASPSEWQIIFDALTPMSGPYTPSIASCYGSIPITDRLWWFPMWHAEKSIDGTRRWSPGYKYVEILWGLALAQLADGRYHRAGYIVCLGKRDESLVEQIEKIPCHEFTFV